MKVIYLEFTSFNPELDSVMVSTIDAESIDPGSIPGQGDIFNENFYSMMP